MNFSKFFAALLLLGLLLSLVYHLQAQEYQEATVTHRSNVRAQPITTSAIVGVLQPGSSLTILGVERGQFIQLPGRPDSDIWYEIQSGDIVGYVYSGLVSIGQSPVPDNLSQDSVSSVSPSSPTIALSIQFGPGLYGSHRGQGCTVGLRIESEVYLSNPILLIDNGAPGSPFREFPRSGTSISYTASLGGARPNYATHTLWIIATVDGQNIESNRLSVACS